LQREAGGLKPLGEASQAVDAKFDLSLDGHRKERVYGNGRGPVEQATIEM
jgi:hypothetical protein